MRTLKLILLIVVMATIAFVMYKATTDKSDMVAEPIELVELPADQKG